MKLAILTHGFPSYANPIAANFLEPFLEEIVKEGHKVWVLAPTADEDKPLPQPYPVQTFPRGGKKMLGQLKLWNPKDFLTFARFLKAQRAALLKLNAHVSFDHVLVVWLVPNALAARTLMRRKRVPYSTWSLGTDINKFAAKPLTRLILRELLKEASYVFANSRKLCEKISEISRHKKVELLPTYTPLAKPAPGKIPLLEKKAFHFLCVARLEPVKGQDILIEAFIKLISVLESRNIHLHLLGDGSLRKRLEKRVLEASITNRVHFYGMVAPIKVAGFLKEIDCLVLPSRNESMPVSFWEAQATGVPVIGTDVGDLGWAIRKFGQGIVVQPEDIDGLTEAMKQMLDTGRKILKTNPSAVPPDPRKAARKFLKVINEQ